MKEEQEGAKDVARDNTIKAYRALIDSIFEEIISQCNIGIKSSKILILASTVSDRDVDTEEGMKVKKTFDCIKTAIGQIRKDLIKDVDVKISEEDLMKIYNSKLEEKYYENKNRTDDNDVGGTE